MSSTVSAQGNIFKEKKSKKRILFDYICITVASLIQSAAISLFLDPNNLAPGGVSGISIILHKVIGIETGTLILLINIPILAVGFWKFGFKFLMSTLYSILIISSFTNIFAMYGPVTDDKLLAALAGSMMMAVAIGWVFKSGATTGGTDIIIKLLRLKFPHLKTGSLFLIIDLTIVAISALVFKDINAALYAGIAVGITSYGLDVVLYGRDGAKLIYIISDHAEQITERLLSEVDAGVTHIQGQGAYSGREKNVIMCVVRIQQAIHAEEIVKEEDPEAFMIVTSATEIYGEGYKSYFSEKL